VVYLLLAVVILVRRPRDMKDLLNDGFRTSYKTLTRAD
jgi:hypothetical protein